MPAPRVLITAGPTHEPIDQVRYLANRSSGAMGMALARSAAKRGWPTTLLLGPVSVGPPEHSHLRTLRFQTTADLQGLLSRHWPEHDLLFMAAAVADFRPVVDPRIAKIPRSSQPVSLRLEPTPDLLAELGSERRPGQFVVGFALEPPEQLLESARRKLVSKGLDAIVANPLETMDSSEITATVLFRDGQELAATPRLSKQAFAQWLLRELEPRLSKRAARSAGL